MITAHELKKILYKLNGRQLAFGSYQLHTQSNLIQGEIFYDGKLLVSISSAGSCSLVLRLPDENKGNMVSFEKEAQLKPDDSVVKIYDTFSEHGLIAEVILAFMVLGEYVKTTNYIK